jgi:predicted alpha-1,2-mannosidase
MKIKKTLLALIAIALLATQMVAATDYTERVNLFLGTASSAQTSPAAILPFGMISPGPFNQPKAPCGYNNRIKELIGFNHTHLQGTGCGSYGLVVMLPTTGNQELGTKVIVPAEKQWAQPGYYKAVIDEMGITAEMTCTKRAAIHRYAFPESDSARVSVDLSQGINWAGHKPGSMDGAMRQVNPTTLSGVAHTTAWREHSVYFHMVFSKPVSFTDKEEQGGYVSFATEDGEALLVKVGISYVSEVKAKLNLNTELAHWDFDAVRQEAKAEWNQQLSKIDAQGGTPDQQANFYSALYHLMFHPQTFNDVNNEYLGMDGKVHKTAGHNHYSVLSLWDTFRAAHPLYTLINPDVQLDVVKTMLDDYRDSGWGPKWKLANKETSIMPGTWADVVIPDAYIKGIRDFDTEAAFALVKKNATVVGRRNGLENYLKLGYVSHPNYINVSRTLEHAYCDFNVGKFAEALGKDADAEFFYTQTQNFQNLWDPQTKFFRGKDKDGNWSYPDDFDPFTYTGKGNNDYCEGNAWQWNWHVMQDTQGLINLMGGDAAFEQKLDVFLTAQGGDHGSEEFGQYWHGNEPDQHALYAYNYVGAPAKAAKWVRRVLEKEYRNDTWGISGNEDAGQMSAWYIFSAMGFYPYLHSVPEYTIGSPIFDAVTLNLPNGATCVITAKDNSAENMYVQSMCINGKAWDKSFLPHEALVNGGTIEFKMGPKPSKWGTSEASRPYSMTPRDQ